MVKPEPETDGRLNHLIRTQKVADDTFLLVLNDRHVFIIDSDLTIALMSGVFSSNLWVIMCKIFVLMLNTTKKKPLNAFFYSNPCTGAKIKSET